MIYISKDGVAESAFVSLLSETRAKILKSGTIPESGLKFEDMVHEAAVSVSKGTEFEGCVEQTSANAFPDIIARKYFGVEVKHTTSGKWSSLGNSVLETTRVSDVERIYIMFGKYGGTPDIAFKPYQDCLADVKVTHYPRYEVNMELKDGESIFSKIGISYDEFRKNPIIPLRDYYRNRLSKGETLWWLDPEGENSTSPIIRSFSKFSGKEKTQFMLEAMCLFPEIFGKKSRTKYERAAAYLFTEYNAVSSSIRDIFSSNGRPTIKRNDGSEVKVSQILYKLRKNNDEFVNVLNSIPLENLVLSWWLQESEIKSNNKLAIWAMIADKAAKETDEEVMPSEIIGP